MNRPHADEEEEPMNFQHYKPVDPTIDKRKHAFDPMKSDETKEPNDR